jgi:hypothetical protein
MTITAYETLYESSIAYGIRKALMAEQRRTEMNHKLKELAFAKKDLQSQVHYVCLSMLCMYLCMYVCMYVCMCVCVCVCVCVT